MPKKSVSRVRSKLENTILLRVKGKANPSTLQKPKQLFSGAGGIFGGPPKIQVFLLMANKSESISK